VAAVASGQCPRCQSGREVFHYLDNIFQYDIDRARALVADGREAVEVEDESVRASVDECTIDDDHVGHVDPTIPGIIAHVFYRTPDGVVRAHLLIDGHHRAARCLKENRPFSAFLLDEEESRQILSRSPDRLGSDFGIHTPPEEAAET